MSHPIEEPYGRRRGRGAVSVLAALAAVAALAAGGSQLRAESATHVPAAAPVVGRTSTVCTVGPATPGSSTSVGTVVVRQGPGREGTLTGTGLGADSPVLTLTEQGKGQLLSRQTASLLLQGVGAMATASAGQVFSTGGSGVQRGLMAAPCLSPATEHWFVGIGATAASASELVLTNPDDAQAEVDLQFFGEKGEVVVPGSPGIIVGAHGSRTIALASLAGVAGPLTMSVHATTGRVAAITRDLVSQGSDAGGGDPGGADWHPGSVAPATRLVIPAVPEGEGARQLVVTNPGTTRAQVQVAVLARAGSFAPAGAASLVVEPNSTVTTDLAPGLVGQYGAVRLTSDRPVTGAVRSTSSRGGAAPDVAVEPASPALVGTGVAALATGDQPTAGEDGSGGIKSELVLSNDGSRPATVSYQVFSYEGVVLRTDEVLMAAGSTSTRRLDLQSPAYLVATVRSGTSVHGGVVYSEPDGGVAGLSSVPLVSPDVASRAPDVVLDPTVGR